MYKTAVRTLVRHGIRRLSEGDPSFLLRLAAPDAEIAFPGESSWSTSVISTRLVAASSVSGNTSTGTASSSAAVWAARPLCRRNRV